MLSRSVKVLVNQEIHRRVAFLFNSLMKTVHLLKSLASGKRPVKRQQCDKRQRYREQSKAQYAATKYLDTLDQLRILLGQRLDDF